MKDILGYFCGFLIFFIFFYYMKRFEYFYIISYFFASFKYKTNILVCSYCCGFNFAFDDYKICYLVAQNNGILICPISFMGKSKLISYDKIINFIIEHSSINDITDDLPTQLYSIKTIKIDFELDDGIKDTLEVNLSYSFYPFNKYSLKKSNFFVYVAKFLPMEHIIQQEWLVNFKK